MTTMMPTPTNRSTRLAALWGVLAGAALVAGCAPLNNELTIGDRVELSTLSPSDRLRVPGQEAPGEGAGAAAAGGVIVVDAVVIDAPEPSLRGILRDNWEPTPFLVPVDGTAHYAETSVHARFTNQNARQVGLYPTENTVLEGANAKSVEQQALEALAEPLWSGLDIVMALPRAFIDPPWSVMQSPRDGHQRGPRPAPVLAPAGGPTVLQAPPLPPEAPPPPPSANPPPLPRAPIGTPPPEGEPTP